MPVSQGDDGTPHLTYYDQPTQLSFVWDGFQPEIQVSHGGYGEPVVDAIHVDRDPGEMPISTWMFWFRTICQNYIRIYEKHGRKT